MCCVIFIVFHSLLFDKTWEFSLAIVEIGPALIGNRKLVAPFICDLQSNETKFDKVRVTSKWAEYFHWV